MQFTLIAFDGTDDQAMERRLAAREAHLAQHQKLRELGNMLYGGAILDDEGRMVGSTIIAEFNTKEDFDEWLKNDPYSIGKVWERTEVYPFKSAPGY